MMKYLSFITFLLIFISCHTDQDINPNDEVSSDSIVAKEYSFIVVGETDSTKVRFCDFDPEIIAKSYEIGCHCYQGVDSVDLNYDFTHDLELYYYLNNDIMGECGVDSYGTLNFKRELIILNKSLQITADSNNYVIPVELGDTINNISNWSNNKSLIMFHANSPSGEGYGYWKWWSVKDDKYCGIRFINQTDTIYGWIKINAGETIIIKEVSVKK